MSTATKLISASGSKGNTSLELIGSTTQTTPEQPSSINVNIPSFEVGDLIIFAACTSSTSAPSSQMPSTPNQSGYTNIRNVFQNETFEISLTAFYTIATASTSSNISFPIPTTYTNLHGTLAWCGVYRNASETPLLASTQQSGFNGDVPMSFGSLSGSGAPFGAFAIGASSSGGTAGDVSYSTTDSYDEFYNINNYGVTGISNRCQLGVLKVDHTSTSTLSFASWTNNATQADGRRARASTSFSMEIEQVKYMYALITNGSVQKYPYTIGNLRRDNPNTSFSKVVPESVLAEYGVCPVVLENKPSYNERTQNAEQNLTPELENETWILKWSVTDKTTIQIQEYDNQKAGEARLERNFLLTDSDWTQVADSPVDQAAWAAYRQALRDIPLQKGFPNTVNWPIEPQKRSRGTTEWKTD